MKLAEILGVDEMTIVNWEVKAKVPRIRTVMSRLTQAVPGANGFF